VKGESTNFREAQGRVDRNPGVSGSRSGEITLRVNHLDDGRGTFAPRKLKKEPIWCLLAEHFL